MRCGSQKLLAPSAVNWIKASNTLVVLQCEFPEYEPNHIKYEPYSCCLIIIIVFIRCGNNFLYTGLDDKLMHSLHGNKATCSTAFHISQIFVCDDIQLIMAQVKIFGIQITLQGSRSLLLYLITTILFSAFGIHALTWEFRSLLFRADSKKAIAIQNSDHYT